MAGEITLTAKSVLAAAQELSQRTREMDKAMEVLLQASSQQHSMHLGEKAKATFDARLKTAAMKDVVDDIRPFDDPAPPGMHDFDLITFLFYYQDKRRRPGRSRLVPAMCRSSILPTGRRRPPAALVRGRLR